MKDNQRQNLGNIAGAGYVVGNILMICKGALENAMQKGQLNFDNVFSDKLSSAAGLTFLAAAGMMAIAGGKTRGIRVSELFALSAYAMLLFKTISQNYEAGAVFGAIAGGAGSAYAVYCTYRQEKDALGGEAPAVGTVLFKDSVKKIIKKFPYLPTGLIGVAGNVFLAVGAMGSGDHALAAVAGIWMFSAGLFALALPKVSKAA